MDVGGEQHTEPISAQVTTSSSINNTQNEQVTQDDISLKNKVEMNYPKTNKYATIDRSHLRKNQVQLAAALKELELKQKTPAPMPVNSSQQQQQQQQQHHHQQQQHMVEEFPDYKMNLPKSKSNTLGRHNIYTSANKPTIFQIFDGQNLSAQNVNSSVLRRISPEKQFQACNGQVNTLPQNGGGQNGGGQIGASQTQNGASPNGVHKQNGHSTSVPAGQFITPPAPFNQQTATTTAVDFSPVDQSSPQHATTTTTSNHGEVIPLYHGNNVATTQQHNMATTQQHNIATTHNNIPQYGEKPALKPKPTVGAPVLMRSMTCPVGYGVTDPKPHTAAVSDDPEPAKPGTFEAQLQERRNSVLRKTLQ